MMATLNGPVPTRQATISNGVAVNQAKACNQAFVNAGVDFVIQVGDLGNSGTTAGLCNQLDANSLLNAL